MLWGIYSAIYGEVNVSVEKCVEIRGDYVEKWQSCFISVILKSWSARILLEPTTYINTNVINSFEIKKGQGWSMGLYYIFVDFRVIW